ncbi:MAG TPA: tetratricopeptide repeat-containing glycosyltransferase family protein [Caulobacteraceae bacterium]|nr:tetratricopeptide repeat-containing glycosyltransferase family protein [Caulobacteraceae bacterium]
MSARTATEIDHPEPAAALMARAAELERGGKIDEARACAEQVLEIEPDHADALQLLGAVAFRDGNLGEAVRLMERSRRVDPEKTLYARNLCEVYRLLGRYDEALEAALKATLGDPRDPIAHVNMSVLRLARGESDEAIISAERALAIDPNLPGAHFGLAEALLLRGEFARGWEEYEWRFRLKGVPALMPRADIPQWQGETVRGRLMLIADQGFGDSIQFGRFIPWAATRCEELVVACGRELQPLIGQFAGVGSMFDKWDECPPSVAHLPLSGLPRLAGAALGNIPAEVPYLRAEPAKLAAWTRRLELLVSPRHRRIGVAWAGRPTHKNDHNRSIRLETLAPVAALDGVTLVSLQKGPPQAQIAGFFGRAPLVNIGAEIQDFTDTAAIIEALDMVITVDTAVAHLAASLGKTTWIMLPFAPDWRWLREVSDSPWYPSVRLFRQTAAREWDPVVAKIAGELPGRLTSIPVRPGGHLGT